MDHPDFRVRGKIFATLGYPETGWGMVKLNAAQQKRIVTLDPDVFVPAAGSWGRAGATTVRLRTADKATDSQGAHRCLVQHRAENPGAPAVTIPPLLEGCGQSASIPGHAHSVASCSVAGRAAVDRVCDVVGDRRRSQHRPRRDRVGDVRRSRRSVPDGRAGRRRAGQGRRGLPGARRRHAHEPDARVQASCRRAPTPRRSSSCSAPIRRFRAGSSASSICRGAAPAIPA